MTEAGFLKPGLEPNDHYTVVPEGCFMKVLQAYIPHALEAWVIWESVLNPNVFLPSSFLRVLHCFEKGMQGVNVPLVYPDCTVEEVLNVLGKQCQENPKQLSWWTYCDGLEIGTLSDEKLDLCWYNEHLRPIIPSNKPILKVLNSHTIVAEHRSKRILNLPSVAKLGLGLENLGKTCFLNAVLQCLLHIPLFLQYLMHECDHCEATSLTAMFQQLIRSTYFNEDKATTQPLDIFEKLCEVHQYEKKTREDANEVFLVLLDILQRETPPRQALPSPVSENKEISAWLSQLQLEPGIKSDLFGGLQQQLLTCSICQHSQTHILPFCSLSLDLPPPRSFSITFVHFDPTQAQRLLQLESDIPLEENAIIHSIRELVIAKTGNPNVVVGENKNLLLESRIGLSNMVTSSSFIALELPRLDENSRLILVDFYSQSNPLCTRAISVHRAVRLADLISDVIYYLVQVEEAVKGSRSVAGYMTWLNGSSNEATFQQYKEDGKLVFVAQDEGVVSMAELMEQGVETIGDLCFNLGDKMPRFRFTSGKFSYGAKGHLKTVQSSSNLIQTFFFSNVDSGLTATLLQLLEFTLRDKPLNEEDLLNCPECQRPTQHIAHLQVLKFPSILPVVFQRVRLLPTQLTKSLINIEYPKEGLDLRELEKGVGCDPAVYDLKAAIQHTGGSLTKGHYVARAEDPVSLQWVNFDDTSVTPGNADVEGVYMLFYTRRLD
jgi:ubiquitin C-terminal hydrolase